MTAQQTLVQQHFGIETITQLKKEILEGSWKVRWGGGSQYKAKTYPYSMAQILKKIDEIEHANQNPNAAGKSIFENNALADIYSSILSLSVQNNNTWYSFWHGRDKATGDFYQRWHRKLAGIKPIAFSFPVNDNCFFLDEKIKRTYIPLTIPFAEINEKQPVKSLSDVFKMMNQESTDKEKGFIFAIKNDGKVLFSPETSSFHWNLTKGSSVLGAGEIYLKTSPEGIKLIEANNRSGLYRPFNEFLKPLVAWLSNSGIITKKALIKNEKEKSAENFVDNRLTLR